MKIKKVKGKKGHLSCFFPLVPFARYTFPGHLAGSRFSSRRGGRQKSEQKLPLGNQYDGFYIKTRVLLFTHYIIGILKYMHTHVRLCEEVIF